MLAAWYEKKGSARDTLVVSDLPDPEPGPGEVRVRIAASAVNPTDTKARAGRKGNMAMQFPRVIPHQDGAGTIDRVGRGVPEERVGQRVWIYEAQWQRPSGTAAQLATVPAENAVPLPERVSFEEGACLGIPAITAHACLFSDSEIAGKTVLVAGGAGAVGYYAVQLARLAGARAIATVGSAEQEALLRQAEIEDVLDRRESGLNQRILQATGGRGVDRIVEVALGVNLPLDAEVLAPSGVIATFASDADSEPPLPFRAFLLKNATIRFVLVYLVSPEAHRAAVRDLTAHLQDGRLRHSISRRFPLREIAAAHEAMEAGHLNGKVIVTL
ncbi:MAG TPA: NADPH:quinone reductase [Myxococcales bacterium]|nr:NADPH:quinone reductase [Myxococcales bacterium]